MPRPTCARIARVAVASAGPASEEVYACIERCFGQARLQELLERLDAALQRDADAMPGDKIGGED